MVGQTDRGEMTRYDLKSGQFTLYLGGTSVEYVNVSQDGQWAAYVTYPQGNLWRSRIDGTERMQLTFPPLYAMMPRWSPQGGKIAFFEFESGTGKPAGMFEISADGGTPRRLAPSETQHQKDPNWSPDGSRIVFGGEANDPASSIRVLDLATNQVSVLPDSQGMFSPRWSPGGRHISACSADSMRLYVFDFQTRKWTEIAKGPLGWTNWSRDGEFIYFLDFRGSGAVRRIRLAGGRSEQVVDLKNFVTAGRYDGSLTLAPDDSPLLLRYRGSQDIYAADWNQP